MNHLVDGEAPMQMLNLVLHEEQYKLWEGQYTKDDDYVDQIQYVQKEEDCMIRQFTNKQLEPRPPLFPIQIENQYVSWKVITKA